MDGGSSAAPSKRLEGKVAIIIGGAKGIGAAAAQIFHENGAQVVVADIQDNLGQDIADKLGKNACYIHCDISNEDDIVNLVDITIVKFGKLDIMYSNAGIVDRVLGSILDTPKSDLEQVLAVNTVGSFLVAKHAAKVMVPQGNGSILFTASACTAIGGLFSPAYGVSKYGILGLVKNLAAELGRHGVRVNCVSPYAVVTGKSLFPGFDEAKIEGKLSESGNIRGRVLKAEDVAKAALYLASDEANYVNGHNLLVDGGYSTVNPTVVKAFSLMNKIDI